MVGCPPALRQSFFSAAPRNQDHHKGCRTRYFSASWGLCEHTSDVESVLIHHAISYSAPVAQLNRVPGYEPGGREFESLRARQSINYLPLIGKAQWTKRSENVAFSATFLPRGATIRLAPSGCRSMRLATELSFSGAKCA